MTDFEKTYQNYNPRAAALAEARALLTEAAKAAMADGTLPEAELPAFIVEIPADTKNGDIASNLAMAGARTWRKAPKMIADALLAHLPSPCSSSSTSFFTICVSPQLADSESTTWICFLPYFSRYRFIPSTALL